MARTKASAGAKMSSGKSSKARCSAAPAVTTSASSGSSERGSRSGGRGNPVCRRDTPKWQKPITNFFKLNDSKDSETEDGEVAGSSKPKPKRNIIQSDEETSPQKLNNGSQESSENTKNKLVDEEESPKKNSVLDETIVLEELTGEDSHKIDEYYTKSTSEESSEQPEKKTEEETSQNANTKTPEESSQNQKNMSPEESSQNKNIKSKEESSKKNSVLDDSIELEELNGEDSHKIEEYYPKGDKGKGVGKRTKGKENVACNIERSKREREDRIEEEGNSSKKIRVN